MDESEARRILGVAVDAPPERIKAAYRGMLKASHPDRLPDAARSADADHRTQRIVAAYRLLTVVPSPGVPTSRPPEPEPLEEPLWNQWNPLHPSHDRYGPNTAWDRVAITAVIAIGLVLLLVFGL